MEVAAVRHNELQECTRISIWSPHMLMSPKPQTDGNTPQTPHIREKSPYNIQISLKHTDAQGSQQMSGQWKPKGRHPHTGGG